MSPAKDPTQLTRQDFVPPNPVRWCPGCGDFAILNTVQKVFSELNQPREKFVVVSGIGCSSRFPYYMKTFGFHTIHGRAPAVATGIKVANPDLSVWVVTGDGDGLSIGGNHLLHALRKNININILLFNNRIYGLTKGQYSPTTELGKVTKSSPMGSIDLPVNPICFAITGETTFVARTVDTNPKHMASVFHAAAKHKGVSFIEIFQNCPTFYNKAWDTIAGRQVRDERLLVMEHNKPLRFGTDNKKGIRINNMKPEVVTIGENGVTEDDLIVHNAHDPDPSYSYMLSQMVFPAFPTPIGIFRDVQNRPTYVDLMMEQIKKAQAENGRNLQSLLRGDNYIEVSTREASKAVTSKKIGKTASSEELQIMDEQTRLENLYEANPILKALSTPLSEIAEEYAVFDLITLSPIDSLGTAIRLMKDKKVGCLPIMEHGNLLGLVALRDILTKVVLKPMDRDHMPVSAIMYQMPEVFEGTETVAFAMNRLAIAGYRHLPVKCSRGRLGLLAVKSLMDYLYSKSQKRKKKK